MATVFDEVLGKEETVMEVVTPGNEPKGATQEIVINDKPKEDEE